MLEQVCGIPVEVAVLSVGHMCEVADYNLNQDSAHVLAKAAWMLLFARSTS